MPFNLLFNQDRTFKNANEIEGLFTKVGDLEDPKDQPVIVTCQRGITACALMVGLEEIGNKNVSMYDGSYTEYEIRTQSN